MAEAATVPASTPAAPAGVPSEVMFQATAFQELYKNPELRPGLLKLLKAYNPNMRIPELDMDERARKAEDRVAALEGSIARDREDAHIVASGLAVEADFPEIEKIMKDKGITNRLTAAEHFHMTNRVARPRSSPINIVELPDLKEWLANPAKKARQEAYKVVEELRRAR